MTDYDDTIEEEEEYDELDSDDELDSLAPLPLMAKQKERKKSGLPPYNQRTQEILVQRDKTKKEPYWAQLPHESDKSYDYFLKYRDMGIKRSLPKLAIQEGVNMPSGRISGHHQRLRSDFAWIKRAQAWDAHIRHLALVEGEMRAEIKALEAHKISLMDMANEFAFVGGIQVAQLSRRVLAAEGLARNADGTLVNIEPVPLGLRDKDYPAWGRSGVDLLMKAHAIKEALMVNANGPIHLNGSGASGKPTSRLLLKDPSELTIEELDEIENAISGS